MAGLNRNFVGMLALVMGILLFSIQDVVIKFLSGDYAVTQAIMIRSIVALPILTCMVLFESGLGSLRSRNFWLLALRGLIMLSAYTTYYMAFPALPLAEAIALFFIAPILVTVMARPFLGETVSIRSWFSVFLGFAGVLIILQPGSALFDPAALLSLISATAYATSMILARRLGVTDSAAVMAFFQNGIYIAGSATIAGAFALAGIREAGHPSLDFLVRPWAMPGTIDLLLLAACGVVAAIASFLLTHAYRLAEANLVTVLEYTGMIWSPLWGFIVFAEVPKWTTIAGMVLIVAAGLYSAHVAASTGPRRVKQA
jgi:drug/metabolite transporter (DMT)-like permease